jgi:hypothetical protein
MAAAAAAAAGPVEWGFASTILALASSATRASCDESGSAAPA